MSNSPRLFDVMRQKMRLRHLSLRTEKTYRYWVREFIRFHRGQHPRTMGVAEVERYLTDLAVRKRVAASTQNQALQAIIFLYRYVLEMEAPWVSNVVRAERTRRLPVVLTRSEVERVLAELPGVYQLIGRLMYGTGMRVLETLSVWQPRRHQPGGYRAGDGATGRTVRTPASSSRPAAR